jgi:plastocyanin
MNMSKRATHLVVFVLVAGGTTWPLTPATAQRAPGVSGRVSVLDKGDKPAPDVGNAVVWLTSARRAAVVPDTVQIVTVDKSFRPRVVVVPVGSVVSFPNSDPFDHNVFSLSQEGAFDLGLYGRGKAKSTQFPRAGIIRVYCNVHANMTAAVVVRDSPWHAQPSGDGTFSIASVPPGEYTLHAWHERSAELPPQTVTVGLEGLSGLEIRLDARGHKFVQHTDKLGQPYARRGRRY